MRGSETNGKGKKDRPRDPSLNPSTQKPHQQQWLMGFLFGGAGPCRETWIVYGCWMGIDFRLPSSLMILDQWHFGVLAMPAFLRAALVLGTITAKHKTQQYD